MNAAEVKAITEKTSVQLGAVAALLLGVVSMTLYVNGIAHAAQTAASDVAAVALKAEKLGEQLAAEKAAREEAQKQAFQQSKELEGRTIRLETQYRFIVDSLEDIKRAVGVRK